MIGFGPEDLADKFFREGRQSFFSARVENLRDPFASFTSILARRSTRACGYEVNKLTRPGVLLFISTLESFGVVWARGRAQLATEFKTGGHPLARAPSN